MNRNYGKPVENGVEYGPDCFKDGETTTFQPLETTYNAHGYYRMANNAPEDHEGYNAVISRYTVEDGKCKTVWGYEAKSADEMMAIYDAALEDHLDAEKAARGYTKRDPSLYADSTVARYRQDAADWTAHRDAVMLYGLEIENKAARGETVPTLAEFKAALPKITWTVEAQVMMLMRRELIGGSAELKKTVMTFNLTEETGLAVKFYFDYKSGVNFGTVHYGDGETATVSAYNVTHTYPAYGTYTFIAEDDFKAISFNDYDDGGPTSSSDSRWTGIKGLVNVDNYYCEGLRYCGFSATSNLVNFNCNRDLTTFGSWGRKTFFNSGITNISWKSISSLCVEMFSGASRLVSIGPLDSVTSVGTSVFLGATSFLGDIIVNGVTSIDGFTSNSRIKSLSSTGVNTVASSCGYNPNLTRVYLPNCIGTNYDTFISCAKLAYVELGEITTWRKASNSAPYASSGGSAPADADGVRLTIKVKNTMDSLAAISDAFYSLNTSYCKVVCSDGYFRYENGAWTQHPTNA